MQKKPASSNTNPKCVTPKCRRPQQHGRYCHKCFYIRRKARDPMYHAYCVLRQNARRRKKPFTITFEYFKRFAIKYQYLDKKGITATSYHVDRIIEELGYVPGNLRVIQNIDNIKKYTTWRTDHKGKPVDFYTFVEKVDTPEEEMPF